MGAEISDVARFELKSSPLFRQQGVPSSQWSGPDLAPFARPPAFEGSDRRLVVTLLMVGMALTWVKHMAKNTGWIREEALGVCPV